MAVNNQFSIAVHMMAGLALRAERGATSGQLAQSVNACPSFLRRTLSKLSKARLVRSTTGKSGSCSLAREPRRISLLDIYRAVEVPRPFAIHEYPIKSSCPVSCGIKPAMEKVLDRAQKSMEDDLARTTLAEFVASLKTA